MPAYPTMPAEQRFWLNVNLDGPIPPHCPELGPCWIWLRSCNSKGGYGRFALPKETVRAHRYSYELAYGPIPVGEVVRHHCDNPPCVRPNHLAVGTHAQNSQDMVARGRSSIGDRSGSRLHPERLARGDHNGSRLHPEQLAIGERHPMHKLTEEEVQRIRSLHAAGGIGYNRLAAMFNISKRTVHGIIKRERWRHLT